MRKIAIIGAGQAGLLLAFGLLEAGYDVTLYSDRDAETILHGSLPNTAVLFDDALAYERSLGLNFWDDEAPAAEGMAIDFRGPDGTLAMTVHGAFASGRGGQALDHRTKFHRWLNEFARRGGRLEIANLRPEDLDDITGENDLTVVAGGKGPITRLFERDPVRSHHFVPTRRLTGAVLTGSKLAGDRPWSHIPFRPIRIHMMQGVGEYFTMPFCSHGRGECRAILIEALPGGPIEPAAGPAEGSAVLAYIQDVVSRLTPEDAGLFADAQLTDPKAWLRGSFTPEVRKPIATLPSGRTVLGIADAVVLNDPAGGQGANNATRMAACYIAHILQHGDGLFDAAWMRAVFEDAWNVTARDATRFTDALLSEPGETMGSILTAAASDGQIARDFVSCFNKPQQLVSALRNMGAANDFIRGQVRNAA